MSDVRSAVAILLVIVTIAGCGAGDSNAPPSQTNDCTASEVINTEGCSGNDQSESKEPADQGTNQPTLHRLVVLSDYELTHLFPVSRSVNEIIPRFDHPTLLFYSSITASSLSQADDGIALQTGLPFDSTWRTVLKVDGSDRYDVLPEPARDSVDARWLNNGTNSVMPLFTPIASRDDGMDPLRPPPRLSAAWCWWPRALGVVPLGLFKADVPYRRLDQSAKERKLLLSRTPLEILIMNLEEVGDEERSQISSVRWWRLGRLIGVSHEANPWAVLTLTPGLEMGLKSIVLRVIAVAEDKVEIEVIDYSIGGD